MTKIETSNAEFSSYSSNEWRVNFETGEIDDPETSLAVMAQDIRFALETDRYKYPIMGANFGATFDDLIGTDYNYIQSEIVHRIRDALSIDDRVISVGDFEFKQGAESDIIVSCVVATPLGNVAIQTAIRS